MASDDKHNIQGIWGGKNVIKMKKDMQEVES